ncbi:MAG: hypothetical protein KKD31_10740, partial [Bacteroidetes bacterium]|nr:hypothetical protein [Bacteroidota bacterium]
LYNTITGQEIEFKYNIPELLADRSFDVIAEYYIDGKRYDSLNITKETILYTDRYMYFNGQDLYFMPYRDFYDYSNKKASVSLRIRIRAGVERIITGDSTFVFRFDVPQVYSVFPVRKSGAMENSNLQCMIKVGRAMEFISFSNPGESIAGVAAGTLKPIFCAASDEVHIEITGQTAEGEEVFVKTTVAVKKLLKKKGKVQLKDGKQKFTLWLEVNK